jgi:hypothetical protein
MLRQCGLAAVPNLIFYYLVDPPVDGTMAPKVVLSLNLDNSL